MARVRIKGPGGKVNFVSDAVIKEDDPLFKSGGVNKGETYVDYQLRKGGTIVDDPSIKINPFDVGNIKGKEPIKSGGYTPKITGDDVFKSLGGVKSTPTTSQTQNFNPTPEQLRQTILQASEKNKLAELSRTTDKAIDAVRLREQGIAPRIQGLKSTASVGTQLGQKRLKDLFAATGMAAGTGAAKAISAEQGLQSQLGALDVQEAQERADVDRDIADIQSEKAFIERQIQAGTATAEAQAQLEALQSQQEAQAKAAEINSEREFKIFESNLEQFNEMELINLKNSLEQDNTVLDAEIQRLRDTQLFEQDSLLKQQASEEAQRLQAIKNSNALKLAGINNAADIAQQKLRGQQSQADILLKKSLEGQVDTLTPNQTSINTSLKNYIGDTEFLSEDKIKERSLEWITRNEDVFLQDPQLLINIMQANNITNEDLREYEEWRDRALNADVFQ